MLNSVDSLHSVGANSEAWELPSELNNYWVYGFFGSTFLVFLVCLYASDPEPKILTTQSS